MCQFKVPTLQHSRGLEKQYIHKDCVKMACSLVLFCILLSITSANVTNVYSTELVTESVKSPDVTDVYTTQSVTEPVQSPPYLCYECNSGNPLGWTNEDCSESGNMGPWNQPSSCSQPCFSGVGLYPAGTVTRGCSANLYLPNGVPTTNGCVEDPVTKDYQCFCSSDKCNILDLTAKSAEYVKRYKALMASTTTTTPKR